MVLCQAEQLFDNPLADFSLFGRAKTDYAGLIQVYDLFKRQRDARDGWSKALWVNLDPQELIDGIENFLKDFR